MSYLDFNKMLDELYLELNKKTKNNTTFYIPEPKINRKPTRLDWLNAKEFLKKVNRSYEHFITFLKTDRNIVASIVNKVFIIQGKYKKEDINKIILEYINKFCKCSVCGGMDTYLAKDVSIRKEKVVCNTCKSTTYCS